jgi:tetratricopeptide (TPR) repeat protein
MKPARAEMGSDPVPQVVIGVTGARPDAADTPRRSEVETRSRSERSEQVDMQSVAVERAAKPTLDMLAEPTLGLVRETERLELVAPPLEPLVEPAPPTEAMPVEALMSRTEELEESIPPASDLTVEPMADKFFSEGEILAARAAAGEHEQPHEWAEVVARESRKGLPEVVERRARLAKYVRWAVGGAAVLCLAALGRTLVAPATSAPSASGLSELSSSAHVSAAARLEAPEPKAAARPPAEPVLAEPAPSVELTAAPAAEAVAPAAAPAPAEPAPAAAETVAVPKVDVPNGGAPAPSGDKTALAEKNDARRALERGKAAEAIAAGERSVVLDPTDGEAWLLLGAAYQDKGNMAEARRAYAACTKEGKRGPIGECRAMLR